MSSFLEDEITGSWQLASSPKLFEDDFLPFEDKAIGQLVKNEPSSEILLASVTHDEFPGIENKWLTDDGLLDSLLQLSEEAMNEVETSPNDTFIHETKSVIGLDQLSEVTPLEANDIIDTLSGYDPDNEGHLQKLALELVELCESSAVADEPVEMCESIVTDEVPLTDISPASSPASVYSNIISSPESFVSDSESSVSSVSTPARPKPYSRLDNYLVTSKTNGRSPENRKERKKLQNKNAAIRYRQKKKEEASTIGKEVSDLENRNTKLKTQVEQLQKEIDYLKNLMKDVHKARGLLT